MIKNLLTILPCFLLVGSIEAFMQIPSTLPTTQATTTKLYGYIAADAEEEVVDMKQGGVGLAQDNAILMLGKVDKKGAAIATDLKRYTELSTLDGSQLEKNGVSVVCKGEGLEQYKDPGQSTETNIILAPFEAVSKALDAVDESVNSNDSKKISINFTGGDDMIVNEVLISVQTLVESLDLSNSIEFRSLCYGKFPADKCSVAVLSFAGGSDSTEDVYWHEGQWWTLSEDNLNTAIE